jgi:hypothetical protein
MSASGHSDVSTATCFDTKGAVLRESFYMYIVSMSRQERSLLKSKIHKTDKSQYQTVTAVHKQALNSSRPDAPCEVHSTGWVVF